MLRANEYTDEDLLKVLDRPFWLARAGSVGLGLPGTLRKALCRAHAGAASMRKTNFTASINRP